MSQRPRTYSRITEQALTLLGQQIQLGRKRRRMPERELAERIGIARSTLQLIEKGSPSVAIGTVLEAAYLMDVVLFTPDTNSLEQQIEISRDKLALLPRSIRNVEQEVINDF